MSVSATRQNLHLPLYVLLLLLLLLLCAVSQAGAVAPDRLSVAQSTPRVRG